MIKYSIYLIPFIFIGCSTKIPVTNISNSLITNKNQTINIESNNDNQLNKIKNDLTNDLYNSGILFNKPYDYNIQLLSLNNHSNIEKYYKKMEYFIKDKYCQKQNNYSKLSENQYNDYKRYNKYNNNYSNSSDYNNKYNNHYNKHNKENIDPCIIEKIDIQECYLVGTKSNLNTNIQKLKLNYNENFNFESNYNQEFCVDMYGYNQNYINQLEEQNLQYNLYNIKTQLFNYIKPNISEIYLEIFEEINSLNLNSKDKDLFEKSVDLINDKNYIQAKNILLNLYNNSVNSYGKIPYELTFNLALVSENLKEYNEAKKYYESISEINTFQHIQRMNRLTTYKK